MNWKLKFLFKILDKFIVSHFYNENCYHPLWSLEWVKHYRYDNTPNIIIKAYCGQYYKEFSGNINDKNLNKIVFFFSNERNVTIKRINRLLRKREFLGWKARLSYCCLDAFIKLISTKSWRFTRVGTDTERSHSK